MNYESIEPWDTLRISTSAGQTQAIVLHVYESGRIKVRHPSGHIVIIEPSIVVENLGYIPSDQERILKLLVKY